MKIGNDAQHQQHKSFIGLCQTDIRKHKEELNDHKSELNQNKDSINKHETNIRRNKEAQSNDLQ